MVIIGTFQTFHSNCQYNVHKLTKRQKTERSKRELNIVIVKALLRCLLQDVFPHLVHGASFWTNNHDAQHHHHHHHWHQHCKNHLTYGAWGCQLFRSPRQRLENLLVFSTRCTIFLIRNKVWNLKTWLHCRPHGSWRIFYCNKKSKESALQDLSWMFC